MFDDAIKALYSKIQGDLSSASPEELAYLGTALEKIGGRATLLDIMQAGAEQITTITEAKNDALLSFNNAAQGTEDAFTDLVNTLTENANTNWNTLVTNSRLDWKDLEEESIATWNTHYDTDVTTWNTLYSDNTATWNT
ncbi:MAG: hypothetical protein U9R03_04505, partial [Candidatus Aerophobetes bacterium]|nr:hypothetical protein [Candidatus Aerophobetes bacterium]